MSVLITVIAALVCGVVSGLGIGGGSLLMIYMTAIAGIAQKTAQGINLLYFLPTALCSLFLHVKNRFVKWRIVIPAAFAGAVCAGISSIFASSLHDGLLRKLFGIFLLAVGLSELFRKEKDTDKNNEESEAS